MSISDLHAHLSTGLTHVCQCWSIARADGVTFGFTDHDRDLSFDGITFSAESGMSAKALTSTTGLSVNNTEAVGLLQSDVITEADILAGRYDGAKVCLWQVQWDNVAARQKKFAGTLGDITRQSGTFTAELRGLTEALNQPQGRTYLKSCAAVLGDGQCKVDLGQAEFRAETTIADVASQIELDLQVTTHPANWFADGKLEVLSGASAGLTGVVRYDALSGGLRRVVLWAPLASPLAAGDAIRLTTGCDKSAATCASRFGNLINFQGFPDVPGDDWMISVPRADGMHDGGSLRR